jgi:hypothetical protein
MIAFCPDLDDGVLSPGTLTRELEKGRGLYLWWD